MSHNLDARVLRSQKLIRDAFIDLLVAHGFDNVTVQAIADHAGINRATFYRHYSDKYDLAEQLSDLLFGDVIAKFQSRQDQTTPTSWAFLFEHVAEYATFYRAMMGKGGIPNFRDKVREAVAQQMLILLKQDGFDASKIDMPPALPIRYLAAAQVGFVEWWLENDMPFSPQEAATYLLTLHSFGAIQALGMNQ